MSAIPSTIVPPKVTEKPGAFFRPFNDCWEGIARYFARRAAIARLRALDDRSLRDIGIARCQIEAAVHGFSNGYRPGEEMIVASRAAPCAAIGSRADARRSPAIAETTAWN